MGREAAGVRGVRLGDGQELIALIVLGEGTCSRPPRTATASSRRWRISRAHGRGGQGVIALQTTDRNGARWRRCRCTPGQEIMLISSTGTLVRTPVDEISVLGRNTQGVRLIRLAEGERLTGIERVESLRGPKAKSTAPTRSRVPCPRRRLQRCSSA